MVSCLGSMLVPMVVMVVGASGNRGGGVIVVVVAVSRYTSNADSK